MMTAQEPHESPGRREGGKFLAQCRHCRRWREVAASPCGSIEFFELLEGEFRCCGVSQRVQFTVEKDYLDFH